MVRPIRSKLNDVIECRKGFDVPIHDFRELGSWKEEGDMIDRHSYLENMVTRWSGLGGTDSRSESKDWGTKVEMLAHKEGEKCWTIDT